MDFQTFATYLKLFLSNVAKRLNCEIHVVRLLLMNILYRTILGMSTIIYNFNKRFFVYAELFTSSLNSSLSRTF